MRSENVRSPDLDRELTNACAGKFGVSSPLDADLQMVKVLPALNQAPWLMMGRFLQRLSWHFQQALALSCRVDDVTDLTAEAWHHTAPEETSSPAIHTLLAQRKKAASRERQQFTSAFTLLGRSLNYLPLCISDQQSLRTRFEEARESTFDLLGEGVDFLNDPQTLGLPPDAAVEDLALKIRNRHVTPFIDSLHDRLRSMADEAARPWIYLGRVLEAGQCRDDVVCFLRLQHDVPSWEATRQGKVEILEEKTRPEGELNDGNVEQESAWLPRPRHPVVATCRRKVGELRPESSWWTTAKLTVFQCFPDDDRVQRATYGAKEVYAQDSLGQQQFFAFLKVVLSCAISECALSQPSSAPEDSKATERPKSGPYGLRIFEESRRLWRDGKPYTVSDGRDWQVLSILLVEPDREFTPEDLLGRLKVQDCEIKPGNLQKIISKLRRQLEGSLSLSISMRRYCLIEQPPANE